MRCRLILFVWRRLRLAQCMNPCNTNQMSNRGFSFHIRGTTSETIEAILSKSGLPCAILGSNSEWTTFIPIDEASFDTTGIAQTFGVSILQVWFDEQSAIVFHFTAPDGWEAELYIPLDGTYDCGSQDERLFAMLVERKLLSSDAVEVLTQKLRLPRGKREEWLKFHGVEELLGLPSVVPMPIPCSEDLLGELAPDAKVVLADSTKEGIPPVAAVRASALAPAETRHWSKHEVTVVDLHFHYLTKLWNLNDWKVYQRYKKHLPAERRGEVDELVNLIMTHAPDERVRQALEAILATIWEADDWDAVIRAPDLLKYEPLDPEQREDWRRRLERVASARGQA
jgi:hypothetical protein